MPTKKSSQSIDFQKQDRKSSVAALEKMRERLQELIADVEAGVVQPTDGVAMIGRTSRGWRIDVEMFFESVQRDSIIH